MKFGAYTLMLGQPRTATAASMSKTRGQPFLPPTQTSSIVDVQAGRY